MAHPRPPESRISVNACDGLVEPRLGLACVAVGVRDPCEVLQRPCLAAAIAVRPVQVERLAERRRSRRRCRWRTCASAHRSAVFPRDPRRRRCARYSATASSSVVNERSRSPTFCSRSPRAASTAARARSSCAAVADVHRCVDVEGGAFEITNVDASPCPCQQEPLALLAGAASQFERVRAQLLDDGIQLARFGLRDGAVEPRRALVPGSRPADRGRTELVDERRRRCVVMRDAVDIGRRGGVAMALHPLGHAEMPPGAIGLRSTSRRRPRGRGRNGTTTGRPRRR